MINKSNFKEVLIALGFIKNENYYYYYYSEYDCELKVDFTKNELIFPEEQGLKIESRTTCNFSANENFVVFECVHRLLLKGYKPQNIVLEPKWQVGHGLSGGKADILIKDNNNKSFLIIECKTSGIEFDTYWKKTELNGGQLFSYARQETSTKYLCMYTSDLIDNNVIYFSNIISLIDNESFLKSLKNPLSYQEATDMHSLYEVWNITYNKEYSKAGIFEKNISPYKIGKNAYSISDLKIISNEDIQKKYHEFTTIMRQHNVSGRENAFDKLVNLFLAKIVDEIQNPNHLQLFWKGIAFDDYYSLQDRIQKLYKDGMEKFLGEKVTYIDNNTINDTFRLFKTDPDATKNTILNYFKQLKFYTNNDFAFLDVHNENLFYQNAEILLKIVKMLQDIQLKTDEPNQFLGDLFEGFLDQGVKQSEGQFFTPMPIVKFLISSLPLEKMINSLTEPPKVIDYACGSGHFLNEYATQIREFINNKNLKNYYKNIYGIEKEYRLSKVAKVSAFMYGQDDINIIYGDALANNSNIQNNTFDILIANPPYSVKGFLETLTLEEREKYEIFKTIGNEASSSNNSIEAFFIERASQLITPGGVAAIVLPSSILNNGSAVYVKAREILLKNFDIISIVEFGSGTFGKTGVNTITLFLRKKIDNPNISEHYYNRVNSWFNNDFKKDSIFDDQMFLSDYCAHINIELEDFKTLLEKNPCDSLLEQGVFLEYKTIFDNSSNWKNRLKQKSYNNLSIEDQKNEYKNRLTDFIIEIEKEKLYYYMLSASNPQPIIIVKSPTKNTDLSTFLGYKWSSAKGNEGIKYLSNLIDDDDDMISKNKGINTIKTPLFNPTNLKDLEKINTIIRTNFDSEVIIPDSLKSYVSSHMLYNLLDFNKDTFIKSIALSSDTRSDIVSKYPLESLGKVCDVKIGGTPSRANSEYFTGNNLWVSISEMDGQEIFDTKEKITEEAVKNSNVKLIPKGTTLLSFKLSIGKVAKAGVDLYTNEAIAALIPLDKDSLKDEYLFYLFNSKLIDLESVGNKAFGKSLNSMFLKKEIKIPILPVDIQNNIIKECQKIDQKYKTIHTEIENSLKEIGKLFQELEDDSINGEIIRLSDSSKIDIIIGKRVLSTQLDADSKIPVYSANVFQPVGFIDKLLFKDFSSDSVIWGIDGDWMVNYIPANNKFYPTDHCGVIRIKTNSIHPRYFAWKLEKEGQSLNFSRSFRASRERIRSISILSPSLKKQNENIKKIEALEKTITESNNLLSKLKETYCEIVKKWI